MSEVLNFTLPGGYRIASSGVDSMVECERGCGWRVRVNALSAMRGEARDQLFWYHEQWHSSR